MGKDKLKDLSILDKDLKIDGTIFSKGKLIIKGNVRGTITGETIIIAEEGSVYAEINVVNITIGGIFEGEIKASKDLVILSSGSCSGKVICKDLVVENGGILNAEVTCKKAQETVTTPPPIEKGKNKKIQPISLG